MARHGNPKGNPEALARWRASLTPEQKLEYQAKILTGRALRRQQRLPSAKKKRNFGLRITITQVKEGNYVVGTSRTVFIHDVSWTPEELRIKLTSILRDMKSRTVEFNKPATPQVIEI